MQCSAIQANDVRHFGTRDQRSSDVLYTDS